MLLALLPLVKAKLIEAEDIIIDAKSGVSGAGRTLEAEHPVLRGGRGALALRHRNHRHVPEIEQEICACRGPAVPVNFTPHLVPMRRGELCTAYVRLAGRRPPPILRRRSDNAYAAAHSSRSSKGTLPSTQYVRGSNYCHVGVFADRIQGRAIVVSAIDNLVKGSAGQAMQNFNLMHGFAETLGLEQLPLFP